MNGQSSCGHAGSSADRDAGGVNSLPLPRPLSPRTGQTPTQLASPDQSRWPKAAGMPRNHNQLTRSCSWSRRCEVIVRPATSSLTGRVLVRLSVLDDRATAHSAVWSAGNRYVVGSGGGVGAGIRLCELRLPGSSYSATRNDPLVTPGSARREAARSPSAGRPQLPVG